MRIAYLSTFYPFRGGISQFNASLYRELEKQHTVKAFTFTRQYPGMLFPGKTQMITNDEKADPVDSMQVLDSINPATYFSTARKIRAFHPDLLIMKYWMSFFGPSLGTVAKLMPADTRVITVLDNVIPHEKRFFDDAFTRYFLKQNDGFIAMSDKVLKDLLTLHPQAKYLRKDHPLYNHFGEGINRMTARAQLNLDPHKKTLLFFGFIRDYKGLDVLIDAFDRLDDSYQLVIAGETYGSFDKYDSMIRSISKKDSVFVFNDYISDQQVPGFFSAADVCILPYKSATQSGITSIAYHFELPIIATDVGGLKETIEDGKTGLIVSTCDPDAIAGTVRKFFDQHLSEKLIEGIREIKESLSWEQFAASLIDFSGKI